MIGINKVVRNIYRERLGGGAGGGAWGGDGDREAIDNAQREREREREEELYHSARTSDFSPRPSTRQSSFEGRSSLGIGLGIGVNHSNLLTQEQAIANMPSKAVLDSDTPNDSRISPTLNSLASPAYFEARSNPVGMTPVGMTPVGMTPVGMTPVGMTPVGTTPRESLSYVGRAGEVGRRGETGNRSNSNSSKPGMVPRSQLPRTTALGTT